MSPSASSRAASSELLVEDTLLFFMLYRSTSKAPSSASSASSSSSPSSPFLAFLASLPPTSLLMSASFANEVVICQTFLLSCSSLPIPTLVTVISTFFLVILPSLSFSLSLARTPSASKSSVEATVTDVPPTKSISKISRPRVQTAVIPTTIKAIDRMAAGIRLPMKSTLVFGNKARIFNSVTQLR